MGERWEKRKDHPLFNHLILKTLFEFMRGKDLKACRLVCKKWCVSSLPSAHSKFNVQLYGNSEEMITNLTDFVQVFRENTLGIPFVKYKLNSFCTTEGPGQEFLKICGSTAKAVTLTEKCTVKVEYITEILQAMPNIEFFRISDVISSRFGNIVKLFPDNSTTKPTLSFLNKLDIFNGKRGVDNDSMGECCPTFIEEILRVAPNISYFHVQDWSADSERSSIGQILNGIEKFERESVIENLDLVNAREEHFESLRKMAKNGLKLKTLYFTSQKTDTIEFYPQLANLFKDSIERLDVDEHYVCSSFIKLPHMPKLDRLRFRISKDFDSKCVNLNKLFPALKELQLYYQSDDEGVGKYECEELLPNSEPCPNVNSISLLLLVFTSQLFDHILNIFPKLTKLSLDFEKDGAQIVRTIMTQLTQLEYLNLWGRIVGIESIDAFLTGIPVQRIQELEHVVTELTEMPVQLREDTIRYYRTRYCHFPYITNLTNLKHLQLVTTGNGSTGLTRLTDVFVYFGLYSMKHINKLEIENCEFTKSGCEILTTEMGLDTWSFLDKDNCFIIPEVD